jgi:uncharacterized membrane protein YraQ (UPF0718 family)
MNALKQTTKSLFMTVPILFAVLLLISLFQTLIDPDRLSLLFSGNLLLDSFIGASVGSLLAGNPITSYVLGGELFDVGVSIMAISAFIVAWVTVGIVQLPAEILLLGKKYALLRNLFSFLSAIFIGISTYFILLVW